MSRPVTQPCGTHGGYLRHWKKGERCEECLAGEAAYRRGIYRQKHPPGERKRGRKRTLQPMACKVCGTVFQPRTSAVRCCSADCGQILRWGHPAERSKQARTCEVCGTIYDATYDAQRTCSRACGTKIHSLNRRAREARETGDGPSCRIWVIDCEHCGVAFVSRRERRRTCSKRCWEGLRFGRPKPGEQMCAGCNGPLTTGRKWCDPCREANELAARRASRKRRKVRERGATSDDYTLTEIAERDGQRCGLCRRLVLMDKQVPHPRAPTIDHVVPLSCGGDDTRANIQLAHFLCNSRKGAGGSQQLALFG